MMHLQYGKSRAKLCSVVPDRQFQGMWRILWPDGRLSDMVNLTWAKDAAIAICQRGPPARNMRMFDWRQERSKTDIAGPPIDYFEPEAAE